MHKCYLCNEPIRGDDAKPGCAAGVHIHRICFDIAAASLSEELKAYARSPESRMEELPDGRFRIKKGVS